MNSATMTVIATNAGGADSSGPRTQLADERRDSADHHHDADGERHQQVITSPRSMTLEVSIVTIERVAQQLRPMPTSSADLTPARPLSERSHLAGALAVIIVVVYLPMFDMYNRGPCGLWTGAPPVPVEGRRANGALRRCAARRLRRRSGPRRRRP
jgi:hypothetical protein